MSTVSAKHAGYIGRTPGSRQAPVEMLERFGLTTPWVAVLVGLLMLGLRVLGTWADGVQGFYSSFDFWRSNIEVPLITTYILLSGHFVGKYEQRSVTASRVVVAVDDQTFDAIVNRMSRSIIRYEWVALAAGAFEAVMVQQIWEWPDSYVWSLLSNRLIVIVEHAFVGLFLYLVLGRTWLFARLYRQPMQINIFNLAPLRPLAQWGLAMALTIIGGITISVLLAGDAGSLFKYDKLVVYLIALVAAFLLFFGSLFSAHQAMAHAKAKELGIVSDNLAATYAELTDRLHTGRLDRMEDLSNSIGALLAYEKRIKEVPEWPYTAGNLGGLFASVLLPLAATGLQQILILLH